MKTDGIYVIVAVKNQEQKIEGFLRGVLFRMIYGKEEMIKQVIVTDLGSNDDTPKIISKIEQDESCIKALNWKECKELIENINQS